MIVVVIVVVVVFSVSIGQSLCFGDSDLLLVFRFQ